jgi:hypothetical protein
MIQKLTKTFIFQLCFGAFRSVVSMWNRRDKQAWQRPHHCRYTPLIAHLQQSWQLLRQALELLLQQCLAHLTLIQQLQMAMQPIASNSNAPPPSSPTTPAALGPPRADLCSSKNSHHRSTTTSNPFVHHKQEEGSSLALQRHMKGIEYTVIYIFLPIVEQYLKVIVHHL